MLQPRDLKGRTAISYARWSSGQQAKGDSLRRQTAEAANFCATYGLTLDRAITDDGVSAFKGANLEASLGQFVSNVREGKIAADVVLIVENIDRITRVKPTRAIRYFLDLLDTGLTLVTLTDQRVHTSEGYDDNFANLMMSLMAMQAAHEYSAKLSFRVGDEWKNRAKRARQGRVKMSKVPFWIDQQTQQLNERADVARMIFRMSKEGAGQWTITNHLNESGIPSPRGGTWGKSVVQDVLKSKASYGSLVVKGEEVPGYYPALITETEWLAIQQRQGERHRNPQASGTTNLFPRLIRCAVCGSPMNVSTSHVRGSLWRYLVCEGKSFKRTDCNAPNWRYDEFEAEFVSRVGLLAVPVPADPAAPEVTRVAELDAALNALETKRANVLAGIAEADTADIRKVLLDQAAAISRDIEGRKAELVRLRESAARFHDAAASVVDIEADLAEIQRLAKEDRKGAQRLIGDLVERIDLETDGVGRVTPETLRRASVTLRNGSQVGFVLGG
ncbi:recombinase family protein [Mesorhizobium sp. CN2-181]|uniref:recombinase family protein n=1 Tax=Mesorhizobium yinganensis TaxID=3157707 RepID=UPI0032B78B3B